MQLDIVEADVITAAGSQKALLDPETAPGILKSINVSVKLHKIRKIVIVAHEDCGAYGGSRAFNNFEEEKKKYAEDLKSASSIVKKLHPRLNVMPLFVHALNDRLNITTI